MSGLAVQRHGARSGAVAGLAAILIASFTMASFACVAAAASLPGVNTGPARQVSFDKATLTGVVHPNGSNTSYFFQYGPTKAYGSQTPVGDIGANVSFQNVSFVVTGLSPVTTYHYRLVAVNASGANTGGDIKFTTAKVPLSLQILVTPNPVLFGGTAIVQGTLSGTGNANRTVILQENPFPYTPGFMSVGNPELTSATGSFSFPVLSLLQATQFRVVTATTPRVVSPIAQETVAVRVSAHVGRVRRRHHARIFGVVSPALNGMEVGFMRIAHGRNVLVSGTILRPRDAMSSRFSRTIPVHRGLYRVFVRVTNGAQVSNYSAPLLIR